MAPREESIDRLSEAIQELGRQDAAEILAEARAGARARVRAMLTDAFTDAMLDHAREQLWPGGRSTPDRLKGSGDTARSASDRLTRSEDAARSASDRLKRSEDAARSASDRLKRSEDTARSASDRLKRSEDTARSAPPDVGGDADAKSVAETAWYVYGVVGAHEAPPTPELTQIGVRQSLAALTEGGLAAVVGRVPAEEFAEDELRANLNDMDWVETVARRHEQVLDALCRRTTVIPMRLCTVYKTEGGVREMLLRESETLLGALEQLRGRTEWGVKVFFERPRASGYVTREPPSDESRAGAAYMDHRRQERERAKHLDEQVEAAVAEIHERLDSLSDESTLNPPQRREVSAHAGDMVLNGAYLVEREKDAAFHEEARSLQSRYTSVGLELVVTGPWPAYNFLPGRIGAAW